MVPSEEEVARIQEAMATNPELPLASAEQFLHMLSTISGLEARLNLWLFKMDYDNMEEVSALSYSTVTYPINFRCRKYSVPS